VDGAGDPAVRLQLLGLADVDEAGALAGERLGGVGLDVALHAADGTRLAP
jgi:hypothetical protein